MNYPEITILLLSGTSGGRQNAWCTDGLWKREFVDYLPGSIFTIAIAKEFCSYLN